MVGFSTAPLQSRPGEPIVQTQMCVVLQTQFQDSLLSPSSHQITSPKPLHAQNLLPPLLFATVNALLHFLPVFNYVKILSTYNVSSSHVQEPVQDTRGKHFPLSQVTSYLVLSPVALFPRHWNNVRELCFEFIPGRCFHCASEEAET